MPTNSHHTDQQHHSSGGADRQISILSTKKLKPGQRELLLNRGIGLVEFDFISIIPIAFQIDEIPENIIFTSKNSVKAILDHPSKRQFQQKNIFCVGDKTAELLKRNGFRVSEKADYGEDLAGQIIKKHAQKKFLFICGKKRHNALPEGLRNAGVPFEEVEVYDTQPSSKKIDRIFDGVMFFSPSAVKSYCEKNDLSRSVAFCIGTTTSTEAEKYTSKIITATTPSIENVIVQVVRYFT